MSKKKPDLYLPNDGRRATAGKYSTSEFSVSGKSFWTRDPNNPENNDFVRSDRIGDGGSAEDNRNKDAKDRLNPIYDYDYGTVRDAAKELEIKDIKSKKDVNQILSQIRGGSKSKAEDFKDDFIEKKITPRRENSDTEVEIPTGNATAGDNSIASSIAQRSGMNIAGNRNRVDQDNSVDQKQAGNFLDKYKFNLNSDKGLNLSK